jgi:GntR family transcriptional regulator
MRWCCAIWLVMPNSVMTSPTARRNRDDRDNGDHGRDGDPTSMLPPAGFANERLDIRKYRGFLQRGSAGHGATVHVTMVDVNVDRDDPLPLHEQVAAEIRRDIANGDASPGDRLPPARDMAAVLGVHPNTVLRAMRALREEGVLEFRRGRGVTIAGRPERGIVAAQATELVNLARRLGFAREELLTIIEHLP